MTGFYAAAALAEIAGCFAVWAFLRDGQSVWWLVPGMLLLGLFAVLLTKVDSTYAGRAYAAYGGIYIVASLLWMFVIERITPDRWDLLGGAVSLLGALIIVYGHRT
ncbi:MAG: YnfA family protein [Parvibaculaceae bacterium]|nr:YnfA family protein [Parvibaculaceae bacterium]HBM87074.1 YnfA family protein [Rhodobiaceae bacterium]